MNSAELCASVSVIEVSVTSLIKEAEDRLSANQPESACQLARAAVELAPDYVPALHLAGLASASAGKLGAAIEFLERAAAAEPFWGRWLADLGTALYAAERFEDAARRLTAAELLAPGEAVISITAGHALRRCGRPTDAAAAYRRALDKEPSADVRFPLGCVLAEAGQFQEALDLLTDYAGDHPDHIGVHRQLAAIATRLRYHSRAVTHFRDVLALQPDDCDALRSLAWAMIQTSPPEETLATFERAIAAGPSSRDLHSTSLMVRLHCAGQTRASIRQAHEDWAERHGSPFASTGPHAPDWREPGRRLRIGYVGGEFWFAPSYFFLFPILSNHDRSRFDLTLYDTVGRDDHATAAYKRTADRFRHAYRMTPEQLYAEIRADEIDVLVDVSGQYESQGLAPFLRGAAPVQVAYPNYPSTTGVAQIGYILSDPWVCPDGHEDQYTEHALRLSSGYLAYTPPDGAYDIKRKTPAEPGIVTLGLFQRATKYTAGLWDAIARILGGRSHARLLVHYGSPELDDSQSPICRRLTWELASRGVAADRVRFVGSRPIAEHLAVVAEADLALDTFPYNGQTTTCECLYLGVPVLSILGDTHVSRMGWHILSRTGLESWVARDVDEYVRLALERTADIKRLRSSHRVVRRRFRNSPMMNGVAITRQIEEAYWWMWRRWVMNEQANTENKEHRPNDIRNRRTAISAASPSAIWNAQ
jgi:predicted O-linked N-acetylglucosamine transferase (SPINDLY family)